VRRHATFGIFATTPLFSTGRSKMRRNGWPNGKPATTPGFEAFHDSVKEATGAGIREATGRPGEVTCRFTHIYPDGPAPYFSFHALGQHGELKAQWHRIKQAASDAVISGGGTITHHHAVGREHRAWYDKERPDLFAAALGAAKRALDPQGLLNPGVLIDAKLMDQF
jgi:alkyldihydroxyacetonephosphate synthase